MQSSDRRRERRREFGAAATEYALLVGAIALVVLAAVVALGVNVTALYESSCDEVADVAQSTC